jgi:hypothetical protein
MEQAMSFVMTGDANVPDEGRYQTSGYIVHAGGTAQ